MADYFPIAESDQAVWFANFQAKVSGPLLTSLGFNVADVSSIPADLNNDNLFFQDVVAYMEQLRADVSETTEWKNAILFGAATGTPPATPVVTPNPNTTTGDGVVARMRLLVTRIKASPDYTLPLGADLGILPLPDPASPSTPSLSLEAVPGFDVVVSFFKYGYSAILLESQRATESAWTSLGMIVASPYTDIRAELVAGQPELRKYRAQYCVGNVASGILSSVVSTVTIP